MKKYIALTIALSLLVSFSCLAGTTLSSLRTDVRALLYETDSTNSIYSDALINDAIQLSQNMMLDALSPSANWNILKYGTQEVTAGVNYYTMDSDFRKIVALSFNSETAIQVKPDEFFAKTATATLADDPMFMLMDSKLYLYPTPTDSSQALAYIYMIKPTVLSADNSEVITLAEYDNVLVILAAYNVLMTDNQAGRAGALEKIVSGYVKQINASFTNSNIIEPVVQGGAQ